MTVGERIKKRRKELDMTVEELATKLNKNRATVYRYESDEIENMSINLLVPISEALKCSPAYLMGWEGEDYQSKEQSKEIEITTIAAHAVGNLSEESIKKIIEYAKFIKSQENEE